jgi:hypothetical protein
MMGDETLRSLGYVPANPAAKVLMRADDLLAERDALKAENERLKAHNDWLLAQNKALAGQRDALYAAEARVRELEAERSKLWECEREDEQRMKEMEVEIARLEHSMARLTIEAQDARDARDYFARTEPEADQTRKAEP